MENIVFSGLVTACLLATWPTSISSSLVKATTDGVNLSHITVTSLFVDLITISRTHSLKRHDINNYAGLIRLFLV